MNNIGEVSRPRLVALTLVHILAAVAVIPTGLLLPSSFYGYVWIAWVLSGIVGWLARREPYVLPSLLVVDVALVGLAHVLLPRLIE